MKQHRGGKEFIHATRVGWASVISAYSPRVRRARRSYPVAWDDSTLFAGRVHDDTAVRTSVIANRGQSEVVAQSLSEALIEEGASIPGRSRAGDARGKRRARAARKDGKPEGGGPKALHLVVLSLDIPPLGADALSTLQNDATRVIDSRDLENGSTIRRRRECEACGHRFTTYERRKGRAWSWSSVTAAARSSSARSCAPAC